jgi:hypothetical protein
VCSAVGGAGNGLWWIAVVTAVQQALPGHAQNSVMAVLEGINQVMPALGFVLGGVATALASPRAAYAMAGAGVALVLLAAAGGRVTGLDAAGAAALDQTPHLEQSSS